MRWKQVLLPPSQKWAAICGMGPTATSRVRSVDTHQRFFSFIKRFSEEVPVKCLKLSTVETVLIRDFGILKLCRWSFMKLLEAGLIRPCDNLSWHGGYGPLLSLFEHLEVPKIHRLPIVWPGRCFGKANSHFRIFHNFCKTRAGPRGGEKSCFWRGKTANIN